MRVGIDMLQGGALGQQIASDSWHDVSAALLGDDIGPARDMRHGTTVVDADIACTAKLNRLPAIPRYRVGGTPRRGRQRVANA